MRRRNGTLQCGGRRPGAAASASGTGACLAWLVLLLAAACGGSDPPPVPPAFPPAVDPEEPPALGRIRAAVERFGKKEGVALEPADPRLAPAGRLLEQGRHQEALDTLIPILAGKPGSGRAALYFAAALHKLGRHAEALPHFERVLEAGPSVPKGEGAFHLYGWSLYHLGRLDEAHAAFEAAVRFLPGNHDPRFALGVCELEAGRPDAAEGHLAKALELAAAARAPRDMARAQARLADVHLARDDLARARAALEECVKLHPAFDEAWHKLSRVCARLGDDEASRKALDEYRTRRNP